MALIEQRKRPLALRGMSTADNKWKNTTNSGVKPGRSYGKVMDVVAVAKSVLHFEGRVLKKDNHGCVSQQGDRKTVTTIEGWEGEGGGGSWSSKIQPSVYMKTC